MAVLTKKKTSNKEEQLAQLLEQSVGAGKKLKLESVDFNDPNRPKTCLEVDFPIIPINQIAQIEGNAGKPIYQMSKWWARRRSSVFRSLLLAAATKAPEDSAEAAKTIWEAYYGNHQENAAFKKLKVADIFMGGGTTLVEGSRLGMQMYGNDLNPVAWLVVKNELSDVGVEEVKRLFDHIEAEVKPQIMPFYACEGPNGEAGKWTHISSGEIMGEAFDPLSLVPGERKEYLYEGPEAIYTFWAKHGPCSAPGCGHRTPIMSNPVVAVKTLSVKAWEAQECQECHQKFDIELFDTRIAPDAILMVSDSEAPFTIINETGQYSCPHCGFIHRSIEANLEKPKNKKIDTTLLVNPEWLKGLPSHDDVGKLGGTATSTAEATQRWTKARAAQLRLIEYRGSVPEKITCPDTGTTFSTEVGTVPKKSHFTCQASTCGRQQDMLKAIKASGESGAMAAYALHGYSPSRNEKGYPYSGRYFKALSEKDVERYIKAEFEWTERSRTDLEPYWPKSELAYGFMTHHNNGGIPNHGFTHWYKMFNPRQLLVLSLILKTIDLAPGFSKAAKEFVLGGFQQYLRNQNLFCIWNPARDTPEPMFSNSNYHPKATVVENAVFSALGRGNWASTVKNTVGGLEWCNAPWEIASNEFLLETHPEAKTLVSGKSSKAYLQDKVKDGVHIFCESSTELNSYETSSFDLVITDPPFGGLLHYAELADFFYVWLRLSLKDSYPQYFEPDYTPKTLEAVANRARHPEDPDAFYKRLLTECWKQSFRILKPGGLLAFTFHHSEDDPWVDVLESLFDAGFYLEATYPIRSDETKGEGAKPGTFGSQTIEYDIVHVCRKRIEEPTQISWARLRRQILADVQQLQNLLEHHQNEGLPKADIQVIKRGKALEYFSKHYGKVYSGEGEEFTVKEALLGINQLLDDQSETNNGVVPVICDPLTRQFLRVFSEKSEIPRDQLQKFLRGTGMAPSDFINRGWCEEQKKIFYWTSPLAFAQSCQETRRQLTRDMDQAMLLMGACYPDSRINMKQILSKEFKPHPALGQLLDWLVVKAGNKEMKSAAITARQLFSAWSATHQQVVQEQLKLFGLED